jgi:hypothetical protein
MLASTLKHAGEHPAITSALPSSAQVSVSPAGLLTSAAVFWQTLRLWPDAACCDSRPKPQPSKIFRMLERLYHPVGLHQMAA